MILGDVGVITHLQGYVQEIYWNLSVGLVSLLVQIDFFLGCVMICFHAHVAHSSSKFLIYSPLNKVCHFSKCV